MAVHRLGDGAGVLHILHRWFPSLFCRRSLQAQWRWTRMARPSILGQGKDSLPCRFNVDHVGKKCRNHYLLMFPCLLDSCNFLNTFRCPFFLLYLDFLSIFICQIHGKMPLTVKHVDVVRLFSDAQNRLTSGCFCFVHWRSCLQGFCLFVAPTNSW